MGFGVSGQLYRACVSVNCRSRYLPARSLPFTLAGNRGLAGKDTSQPNLVKICNAGDFSQ